MSDQVSLEAVERALATVMEPELHRDLMSLQMVRDLTCSDGTVSMRIVLTTPACPLKDRIGADVESALVGRVPGVETVSISWDSDVPRMRGLAGRREIAGVRNAVAVSAGKGGVGKTTVAVNIAVALGRAGASVGLLDADVYGPNVPIMLGLREQPQPGTTKKIRPMTAAGIRVMSFGTILKPGEPVIWRGPMLAKVVQEFLYEVEWGELDYLIVDLPPGTGDVQLTLAQSMPMTGSVIVTTPQDVSIADVSRGIRMFRTLNVPVLGLIENMSGFVCPHCGERTDVFGSGGGRELAATAEVPFLGAIPLDPRIRLGGGEGSPLMAAAPDGPAARVFVDVACHIAAEVSKQDYGAVSPPRMPGPRVAVPGAARPER